MAVNSVKKSLLYKMDMNTRTVVVSVYKSYVVAKFEGNAQIH